MGCSNALNENDLDIAAKFQSMAFNYQPADVKVRPLWYCFFYLEKISQFLLMVTSLKCFHQHTKIKQKSSNNVQS